MATVEATQPRTSLSRGDSAKSRSDSDVEECWICLSSAGTLTRPCKCPRVCHRECIATWQLINYGRREESCCRFCQQRLPALWRGDEPANPAAEELKVAPVMAVRYSGPEGTREFKMRVRPGPDGLAAFKAHLKEALGFEVGPQVHITFECQMPSTGALLTLTGINAYGAATHCAALLAAQRHPNHSQSPTARAAVASPPLNPFTPFSSSGSGNNSPQHQQHPQHQHRSATHSFMPASQALSTPRPLPWRRPRRFCQTGYTSPATTTTNCNAPMSASWPSQNGASLQQFGGNARTAPVQLPPAWRRLVHSRSASLDSQHDEQGGDEGGSALEVAARSRSTAAYVRHSAADLGRGRGDGDSSSDDELLRAMRVPYIRPQHEGSAAAAAPHYEDGGAALVETVLRRFPGHAAAHAGGQPQGQQLHYWDASSSALQHPQPPSTSAGGATASAVEAAGSLDHHNHPPPRGRQQAQGEVPAAAGPATANMQQQSDSDDNNSNDDQRLSPQPPPPERPVGPSSSAVRFSSVRRRYEETSVPHRVLPTAAAAISVGNRRSSWALSGSTAGLSTRRLLTSSVAGFQSSNVTASSSSSSSRSSSAGSTTDRSSAGAMMTAGMGNVAYSGHSSSCLRQLTSSPLPAAAGLPPVQPLERPESKQLLRQQQQQQQQREPAARAPTSQRQEPTSSLSERVRFPSILKRTAKSTVGGVKSVLQALVPRSGKP